MFPNYSRKTSCRHCLELIAPEFLWIPSEIKKFQFLAHNKIFFVQYRLGPFSVKTEHIVTLCPVFWTLPLHWKLGGASTWKTSRQITRYHHICYTFYCIQYTPFICNLWRSIKECKGHYCMNVVPLFWPLCDIRKQPRRKAVLCFVHAWSLSRRKHNYSRASHCTNFENQSTSAALYSSPHMHGLSIY